MRHRRPETFHACERTLRQTIYSQSISEQPWHSAIIGCKDTFSSTLLHDNQPISLLLSYMNGMFLKYICLVLLNGIWRKEDINIIRKGRKHTSKSPSSNLPESHSGTISSIGHGIRPNMACRTVPLRLLLLCSMSMSCCSRLSYSTVLTVRLHGICIFSTSQRGYWAISLFRLSYWFW